MAAQRSFIFESAASDIGSRFDDFIAWAEPGGAGGFSAHQERFDRKDPYFTFSKRLLPHSHDTQRSWFVRQEYIKKAASGGIFSKARAGTEPEIRNRFALIRPGRFLSFAKAYTNIYCEIRGVRSAPKPTIRALVCLEKALRDLNGGNNDPSNLTHQTFHKAALLIQRSSPSVSGCFDAGKALEHVSMLVQSGGRFKGDKHHKAFPGFNLLGRAFSFRSPIKSPLKHGKKVESDDSDALRDQLSSEDVAAVGLAYRRALQRFGVQGTPTFFGALMGLTLTTASMRASELQSLRADALYKSEERYRLRVPRPKLGIEQDVPVPSRLGPLAAEIFDVVLTHSAEARAALKFYIEQSPNSLAGVHTLYVPASIKPLLRSAYLSKEEAHAIINPDVIHKITFPQRLLGEVPVIHFVEKHGDIYGTPSKGTMARLRDVVEACKRLSSKINVPADARSSQFISARTAKKFVGAHSRSKALLLALRALFSSPRAKKCKAYMPRDEVLAFLLADFKRSTFPHWPYTSKDHSVRLDSALALHFEAGDNAQVEPGMQRQKWWLPRLLSVQTLNSWVSGNTQRHPILFSITGVRNDDGSFPRVSVQRTRRYHHTAALLAGASPLFANELAGRQSGWQGEAYDYRTPREIVRQSIDTYDPDQKSEVIGPVADDAPSPKRVVERRIFLAENAAPKHVTEIGGCPRYLVREEASPP